MKEDTLFGYPIKWVESDKEIPETVLEDFFTYHRLRVKRPSALRRFLRKLLTKLKEVTDAQESP